VVIRDELECVCNALNEVVLFDICHGFRLDYVRFVLF
jgi:hypothetical protein